MIYYTLDFSYASIRDKKILKYLTNLFQTESLSGINFKDIGKAFEMAQTILSKFDNVYVSIRTEEIDFKD